MIFSLRLDSGRTPVVGSNGLATWVSPEDALDWLDGMGGSDDSKRIVQSALGQTSSIGDLLPSAMFVLATPFRQEEEEQGKLVLQVAGLRSGQNPITMDFPPEDTPYSYWWSSGPQLTPTSSSSSSASSYVVPWAIGCLAHGLDACPSHVFLGGNRSTRMMSMQQRYNTSLLLGPGGDPTPAIMPNVNTGGIVIQLVS